MGSGGSGSDGSGSGGSINGSGSILTSSSVSGTSPVATSSLTAAASVYAGALASMIGSVPDDGDIPNDPGKMFIGGLSWQTTPESIRLYFSNYGELAEVMVMKDPATRRSRGFGFVTFSDPSAVDKVLAIPVHTLDGKVV